MPIIRSLSTAVAPSGLPLECSGSSAVGRGRSGPDRSQPTTLLPPRSNGKPEAATAVDELLMMGMRMPETCWAVFKWRAINLRDWCIWLVDLFELKSFLTFDHSVCHICMVFGDPPPHFVWIHHHMSSLIKFPIKLGNGFLIIFYIVWN